MSTHADTASPAAQTSPQDAVIVGGARTPFTRLMGGQASLQATDLGAHAIRGAIDTVKREGGEVVGAVLMLDRQEVGKEGRSMIAEVEELLGGKGRVPTILKMRDLMAWLQAHGRTEELEKMQEYWEQYGAKDASA